MLHSIIIPHRNRNRAVYQTLRGIHESARTTNVKDYEVLLVDAGSLVEPAGPARGKVIQLGRTGKLFNKPRCLNAGLDEARGEMITFLDGDMLVGRRWMEAAPLHLFGPDPPHRLCYRVRRLRVDQNHAENQDVILNMLEHTYSWAQMVDSWFSSYDSYSIGWEAYASPDLNDPHGTGAVFGNSQWSIRRDVLGDLRFNEEMDGAGFEDLWMVRQVLETYDGLYRGKILTDADHALLHIDHPRPMEPSSDWCTSGSNKRNKRLYMRSWPQSEFR